MEILWQENKTQGYKSVQKQNPSVLSLHISPFLATISAYFFSPLSILCFVPARSSLSGPDSFSLSHYYVPSLLGSPCLSLLYNWHFFFFGRGVGGKAGNPAMQSWMPCCCISHWSCLQTACQRAGHALSISVWPRFWFSNSDARSLSANTSHILAPTTLGYYRVATIHSQAWISPQKQLSWPVQILLGLLSL